jgi:glycerophosphoryl diester phosphodiesterase
VNKADELIIAHRGESVDAPENTLAAINLAWGRRIKSVEIDIRLCKDNEIVVIHDKDTLRISGEKKIIRNSSLKELKLLDAGSFKSIKWEGETIPTLKEVINTVPGEGRLIIEIKSDENILGRLKTELSQSKLKDSQIELIAFNKKILMKARHLMPNYKILWLMELDYFWPWWICRVNKQKIIRMAKKLQLDGVNVWCGKLLTEEFIRVFKDAGLLIYAWTVNDPVKAFQLIKFGIDGITTDRAGMMAEKLH